MKLLFAVQRYGEMIAGGAESFCREYASRLVARGHDVDVVTSCATSYVDWANVLPAGITTIDGVTVTRLPVVEPRRDELFGRLNTRVLANRSTPPFALQEEWIHMAGPRLSGYDEWLNDRLASYDAAVFFTYLYYPTWRGLRLAVPQTATVLHPTAHDEPPIYLSMFDLLFRMPDAFGFLTEEEETLVRQRLRVNQPSIVTGVGVDLDVVGDAARFRERYDLGDDPYLLYVGRLDPHKGADELHSYFIEYKARNPGPLKLVFVGDRVRPLAERDDIVMTGFVDEQTKHDALGGALAFVHPSYFESFSIVLCEAWAHRTPALIQGRCEVLAGQSRRSGGGLPYSGFAEFESAVDLLAGDATLRRSLGEAGRAYVEERYDWETMLSAYERFLLRVVERRHRRATARHA